MKKKLIFSGIAVVGLVIAFSQLAWLRVWRARVLADGVAMHSARVYKNRTGEVLIDLKGGLSTLFVVRGSTVGIPNISSIVEFSPFAFAKQRPLRVVDVRTDKAGSIDPQLSNSAERLSFFVEGGKTIQVYWK
jgi:hypothetical protein